MKKIRAKNIKELRRLAPENEWVEAEFTAPIKVVSIFEKKKEKAVIAPSK